MIHPGTTHRGAPFVGRSREMGLLLRLLREGLAGSWRLLCVTGEPGTGRRRLLAEALRHGPDAEWIQLAPGGAVTNLEAWARAELLELLDAYPEAPYPSWALHALSRWVPGAGLRASVPVASAELLPAEDAPEILGSAVGAVLGALTGRTLVLVDAGLWPRLGSVEERAATAMTEALARPGVLTLAACEAQNALDPPGVRTLRLGPLSLKHVQDLVAAWDGDRELAAWLFRISGGHPLFLHETVRWLEELGHLRVDDDARRIVQEHGVESLPLPLGLAAVMETRYRRLPADAAHLLGLLVRQEHGIERDALRRLWGDEDDVFENAVAALRRRDFLLHRTFRRPLAVASPLWGEIVETARRRPYRARRRRVIPASETPRPEPQSPLAKALRLLEEARVNAAGERDALAQVARLLRGRRGPAWDGVRGRLAVLCARHHRRAKHSPRAVSWARWGRRHLAASLHPGLRRSLGAVIVAAREEAGEGAAADRERRDLLDEALCAGHFLAAARLRAAWAEGLRRRGETLAAHHEAVRAEAELRAMGDGFAARAAQVRDHALNDLQRGAELTLLPSSVTEPDVRLYCFGRPRVVIGSDEWPLALWPPWWMRLLVTVVSRDLLEESLSVEDAEALLAGCDDAPSRSLETVLHEATQLLRGVTRVPGGVFVHEERVIMNWKGIHGDARAFFAAAPGTAWRHVTGGYLPGVEGDAVEAARRRFVDLLRVDLAAIPGPLDPESTIVLLEGAGRVVDLKGPAGRSVLVQAG